MNTVARRRSTYEANRAAERAAVPPPSPVVSARALLDALDGLAERQRGPVAEELASAAAQLRRALAARPADVDAVRAATRRGRVALDVAADHMPAKENL